MLSRREFLKRAGVMAGSTAFAPDNIAQTSSASHTVTDFTTASHGRAFQQTPVYALPDVNSQRIGEIMPDEVVIISSSDQAWYKLATETGVGYIPRERLQPILPYQRPAIVESIGEGFWAELIAPTSVSHAWCAAAAPVTRRFHYGAMVYVVARMVDDRGAVWYGLRQEQRGKANSPVNGWAAALQYHPWITPEPDVMAPFQQRVEIDTQQQQLLIYDQDRVIGRMPIYSARWEAADTTLTVVEPSNAAGVPWIMRLGTGQSVSGTFEHNRFGMRAENFGRTMTIDLPTFGARWLYERLLYYGHAMRAIIV